MSAQQVYNKLTRIGMKARPMPYEAIELIDIAQRIVRLEAWLAGKKIY